MLCAPGHTFPTPFPNGNPSLSPWSSYFLFGKEYKVYLLALEYSLLCPENAVGSTGSHFANDVVKDREVTACHLQGGGRWWASTFVMPVVLA